MTLHNQMSKRILQSLKNMGRNQFQVVRSWRKDNQQLTCLTSFPFLSYLPCSVFVNPKSVEKQKVTEEQKGPSNFEEYWSKLVSKENIGDGGSQNTRYRIIPIVSKIDGVYVGGGLNMHYEPKSVSIGPYHHKKDPLKSMDEMKLDLTKFIFAGNKEYCCEAYDDIKKEELRKCYPDNFKYYDDHKFTQIMLEDGCFLLCHLLACYWEDGDYSRSAFDRKSRMVIIGKIDSGNMASVIEDLFLVDNQIPHVVLVILWEIVKRDDAMSVQELTRIFINKRNPIVVRTNINFKTYEPQPAHLLGYLWTMLTNQKLENTRSDSVDNGVRSRFSYRNISELTAAGIRLTPIENFGLQCISLSSHGMLFFRKLQLPQIIIHKSTESMLKNLIAYETWCSDSNPNATRMITSYVRFLDSLIDDAEDIKQLREAHVLENRFGSDRDAAGLFNRLGRNLALHSSFFPQLQRQIQNHCDNRLRVWIAEMYLKYFSSPWSIISLIAAIYLLILTSLSTFQNSDCDHL